jgi:MFS family permease
MRTSASDRDDQTRARRVYLYFGPLTLLVYLVDPSSQLLDIATAYMMKNQLHADAGQVAMFRLVTAMPVYAAFVFGFARDRWNLFGLRDRGQFLAFAPVTAATFIWLALAPLSYSGLLLGMLLVMVVSRFLLAAHQGLIALIGQEQLMSGRLSVLWNILSFLPLAAGSFAAGYLTEHVAPRSTFLIMASLSLLIAVYGFLRPAAVFSHAYEQPLALTSDLVGDVRRLLRHRAIYPAILIMLMFQFSPGSNTVLQFYLTDELHASDAAYGYWNGIFLVAFLPVFLLYGRLCKRVPFGRLLWWGTAISVPQMMPLVFIHSTSAALWLAVPIGMMGGIMFAAIYDLAMRSCPPGLQGTLMMLVAGVYALATRAGDLLGTWIYAGNPGHGFLYCALATTAVYAAILPVILLVPRELLATADGEPNPESDAPVGAEVAG